MVVSQASNPFAATGNPFAASHQSRRSVAPVALRSLLTQRRRSISSAPISSSMVVGSGTAVYARNRDIVRITRARQLTVFE